MCFISLDMTTPPWCREKVMVYYYYYILIYNIYIIYILLEIYMCIYILVCPLFFNMLIF